MPPDCRPDRSCPRRLPSNPPHEYRGRVWHWHDTANLGRMPAGFDPTSTLAVPVLRPAPAARGHYVDLPHHTQFDRTGWTRTAISGVTRRAGEHRHATNGC